MQQVGTFASRQHAEIAASMLEAYGIGSMVIGDDAGGLAPHVNLGMGGGYRLAVPADRAEEASGLLDTVASPSGVDDDERDEPQRHLIIAGRLVAGLALLGMLIGISWSLTWLR